MIRKTGIKIIVKSLRWGAYTAEPISHYWRKAFAEHILEWKYNGDCTGIPKHELCQAYFQGSWELPATILDNRQYTELAKGWDITVLVDPWEFGHWLGYDAHTITYKKG